MINLHLLNTDRDSKKPYELVFANRASNLVSLVNDENPDIGLLDIDQYKKKEWEQLRNNKTYPVILISNNPIEKERLVVTKPVKFSELLDLISTQISMKLEDTQSFKAASCTADNIKKEKPCKVIQIKHKQKSFKANNYIVGYLSEVNNRNDLVAISLFQWKGMWLLVDEAGKRVFSNTSRNILNHLSSMSVNEISRKTISLAEAKTYLNSTKMADSLENIIWSISPYIGGQGLPHDLDLEITFKLDVWPNFTQYPANSVQLAIASHWIDNNCSISELIDLFEVQIGDIASFLTSCHLSGFLIRSTASKKSSLTKKTGLDCHVYLI